MNFTEKKIGTTEIYNGRIIKVRNDDIILPDGNKADREVVSHPGGAGVVAIDGENNIILVKQYRYPYGEELLEIPAGKRDKGEDPLVTAKRELMEETGAVAQRLIGLGEVYPTPGYVDEVIYIYKAIGLTFGEKRPDEDEFVATVKIPFKQAVQMVLGGEIKDAKTQIAILKCAMEGKL